MTNTYVNITNNTDNIKGYCFSKLYLSDICKCQPLWVSLVYQSLWSWYKTLIIPASKYTFKYLRWNCTHTVFYIRTIANDLHS